MRTLWIPLAGYVLLALSSCQRAEPEVSFAADVEPILHRYCLDCHAAGKSGYEASGLSVENYEMLMKGTRYGPVVVPGDSFTSVLTMLIEGRADPSIKMPHGDRPGPSEAKIEILNSWIDQGAKDN